MSASFTVLSCASKDAARWQSLIDRLPLEYRDVFYSPKYAKVQEALGQGCCFAAVYLWDEYFVLQPFMWRGSELVSYYGAGGPISNHSSRLWLWFDESFAKWRGDNKITGEYTRLHPILGNWQRKLLRESLCKIEHLRDAVVVNLERADDGFLANFSRNRRRGVQASIEKGVGVEQSYDASQFGQLYRANMQRLGALEEWKHSDGVWAKYLSELEPGYVSLLKTGESMLLLLHGFGRSYAHYIAGSDNHDLLYFTAMKHCRDLGAKIMLLGGGTTSDADDPLFQYKLGFSKTTVPVSFYKRTFVADRIPLVPDEVGLATVWCG